MLIPILSCSKPVSNAPVVVAVVLSAAAAAVAKVTDISYANCNS